MVKNKSILIISSYAPSLINFRFDLILHFKHLGFEVFTAAPEKQWVGKATLIEHDISYCALDNMTRQGLDPLKDIKLIIEFRNLFRTLKPDYVLAYTPKPVIYSALAAVGLEFYHVSLVTGLGYYFTDGGSLKKGLIKNVQQFLYKMAYLRSDQVIFQNSDDFKEFTEKKILPKTKANIVDGSGINLNRFKQKRHFDNKLVVLLVARMVYSKGVDIFLKLAEVFKNDFNNIEFHLVGPLEPNASDSVPAHVLEVAHNQGYIKYFGAQQDVRKYLLSASLFILPSRYREGVPRTLLEALATGLPILTNNSVGCKETVKNGENGFLIDNNELSSYEEKIHFYRSNPQLLSKHGEQSRQMAQDIFDVKKINEKMSNIIFK